MEIQTIEPFLAYFGRIHERTRRVAACVPPDAVEWRPREGAWSVGDTLRHLGSIERWMFAENVSGRPSRYAGHGAELAEGRDGVLAYFDAMHAESMDIFRALTPDALQSRCTTPGGVSMPVWKWLRAMVEHEIHHRGQIYLLLNLLGVPTPPLYGLTSEEVRDRSVHD